MAYVVLKGEKKLADVVGRAYGTLKPADARRAEAVLLRANPRLANLRDLAPGETIVVPTVPGLARPADGRTETPAPAAVVEVRNALEAYRKGLGTAVEEERTAATALVDLIKSKELKAVVREMPEAGEYVERVASAAKGRRDEHDGRAAFLKILTKAEADLDALIKNLG